MGKQMMNEQALTARQLRPVVITVVAAKMAVFALLMMTIQFPTHPATSMEVAEMR